MRLVKELEKKVQKLEKTVSDHVRSSTDKLSKLEKDLVAAEKRAADRLAKAETAMADAQKKVEQIVKDLPAMEKKWVALHNSQAAELKAIRAFAIQRQDWTKEKIAAAKALDRENHLINANNLEKLKKWAAAEIALLRRQHA